MCQWKYCWSISCEWFPPHPAPVINCLKIWVGELGEILHECCITWRRRLKCIKSIKLLTHVCAFWKFSFQWSLCFHKHIKIGGNDLKHNSHLDLLVVLAVRFIYCFEAQRKLAVNIYIRYCSVSALGTFTMVLHTLVNTKMLKTLGLTVFNFLSGKTLCRGVQLSHCE